MDPRALAQLQAEDKPKPVKRTVRHDDVSSDDEPTPLPPKPKRKKQTAKLEPKPKPQQPAVSDDEEEDKPLSLRTAAAKLKKAKPKVAGGPSDIAELLGAAAVDDASDEDTPMPEATQPKPPRPPPPAPQPTPKPVAASPKPIRSVLVKDNGDKAARHLGERVPGFQRLSESRPDDTFYVKREMLALWATITPKIAAQFNPSGKVTKADLEKLAYAPKGSDKTPKSSYTSAVALGAVPVTMRVACSAENAQATLQKLHNAKKLRKRGYLTHEDLVVNRTMVLNKSNDPGEKIRSAIRAKLVAKGHKIAEGNQGTVSPDVTCHGDTLVPALSAIFETLPRPTKLQLAHPENYGPMYPVTFEQDTEYQRLYGLSDKHAQFDAHVNQAQQLTGLPWQAD